MMRVLLILLLTPALLYGGTLGLLWYKVKSDADALVQNAAPVAEIRYGSIYVSPLGNEIGLNEISIRPNMTQDLFRIEQVRLSVPHVGYFISANDSVEKRKLPEHIGMQLRRVQFDIDSELLLMAEQMQRQQQAMLQQQPAMRQAGAEFANALSGINALGCGDVQTFSLTDYRNMGIGKVVADVGFNIGYDEAQSRTRIDANISVDGLYQMDLAFEIPMRPDAMNRNTFKGIPTSTFSYRDAGFHQMRNRYCAKQIEGSEEEYVDNHVALLGRLFNASFPESATTAYKNYLLKGGNYSIRLEPQEGFALEGIEYYRPDDIVAMLGLDMRINNTPLDTAAIQWGGTPRKARASSTPRATTSANDETSRPPTNRSVTASAAPSTKRPTYHLVDVHNADKYLHKMVEITTREGKVRKGELKSADSDRITLVIKLSAGEMTYPIETHTVDQLRVYY